MTKEGLKELCWYRACTCELDVALLVPSHFWQGTWSFFISCSLSFARCGFGVPLVNVKQKSLTFIGIFIGEGRVHFFFGTTRTWKTKTWKCYGYKTCTNKINYVTSLFLCYGTYIKKVARNLRFFSAT